MDQSQFTEIVNRGVKAIPEEFRNKLDNVSIFVEPEPTWEQRRKISLRKGWTLFGLYEGVPLTKRGWNYSMVLPDKITIFQNPIQNASRGNPEVMEKIVEETVWHEIAHHLGMNEDEVRKAEENRRNSDK